MVCNKCGQEIPEGSSTCPKCGNLVLEDALAEELQLLFAGQTESAGENAAASDDEFASAIERSMQRAAGAQSEPDAQIEAGVLDMPEEHDAAEPAQKAQLETPDAAAAKEKTGSAGKTGKTASAGKTGKAEKTGKTAKNRKKKKRHGSGFLLVVIIALVVAIAVFGGIGLYTLRYARYDKILPNVYVAGIPVGGMTIDEATEAVTEAGDQQVSINVVLPDRTLTFTPVDDAVSINVKEAVVEAYNYGRAVSNPFTLARAIRAAERTRIDVDISAAVTVDSDYVYTMVINAMDEISSDMTESTVEVDEENRVITVTLGTSGKVLDANTVYQQLCDGFSSGNYADIQSNYVMFYPEEVDLTDYYKDLTVEPMSASYNKLTGEITESKTGYLPEVSLDDAQAQLAEAAEGTTLTFAFTEAEPEITEEQLKKALFRDELDSCTLECEDEDILNNMALACEALDGTVLLPGESFSFNDTVGDPEASDDYVTAAVRPGDSSTEELGGGISQVATALYQCCLLSDLTVTERFAHTYAPEFTDPGLDAYASYGSKDLKFDNSTDYPLRIDAEADPDKGTMTITLTGTNAASVTVKLETENTDTVAFTSSTVTGSGEDVSGIDGSTWTLVRKVYDKDNKLIRTDSAEDLDQMGSCGTTVYEARDAVDYVAAQTTSKSSTKRRTTTTTSPSASAEPSAEASAEPSASASKKPSTSPSAEPSATATPKPSATAKPTATPEPTAEPTTAPTPEPTTAPTAAPIADPTTAPAADGE